MEAQKLLVSMAIEVLPLIVHFDPARTDALDEIHARGTLRVAVPQDFSPFGSVGSSMHLEGVDIDVSALIAKMLGAKLELVPVTMENWISALREKKVDLIISALGKNAEHQKLIDFSQSYPPYNNSVCGVVALKVDGPADLASKTIGVTHSTFEDLISACHVGLNKDEPRLLAKIDRVLSEAKKNGELNAIMRKWLHVPLPQKMAQSTE